MMNNTKIIPKCMLRKFCRHLAIMTQTVRSDFMIVPGAEDNSNQI